MHRLTYASLSRAMKDGTPDTAEQWCHSHGVSLAEAIRIHLAARGRSDYARPATVERIWQTEDWWTDARVEADNLEVERLSAEAVHALAEEAERLLRAMPEPTFSAADLQIAHDVITKLASTWVKDAPALAAAVHAALLDLPAYDRRGPGARPWPTMPAPHTPPTA